MWEENKKSKKFEFLIELENFIQKKFIKDKSSYKHMINKTAQKFGEEATELIIEAKEQGNKKKFLGEGADLFFHYLILLNVKGFEFKDILKTLKKRDLENKNLQKIENLLNKIYK